MNEQSSQDAPANGGMEAVAFRESPGATAMVSLGTGLIVLGNPALGRALGIEPDRLSGQRLWPESVHERVVMQLAAEGTIPKLTFEFEHPGRGRRDVLCAVNAVAVDGEPHALVAAYDITEPHRARQELLLHQREARAFFEHVPAIIFTSTIDDEVVWCNQQAVRRLGFPDPGASDGTSRITEPPEFATQLAEMGAEVVAGASLVDREIELSAPDGEPTRFRFHRFPIRDQDGRVVEIATVGRDLTERSRAFAALEQSERRFRELADNLDEVFVLWEMNPMHILYMSPSATTVFGVDASTADMADIATVIHPDDVGHMGAWMRSAAGAGAPVTVDFRVVRADGETRWVRSRTSRVASTGGSERLSSIIADITEQRVAEIALVAARAEAEIANRAKSEFLSRMSHELRTPLNSVLGFGSLLRLDHLEDRHRDYVDHIMSAGEHLLELINEVLDVSRIESGQLQVTLQPVRMADIVRDALDVVAPVAGAAQVTATSDPIDDDVWVIADAVRLRQVLLNLLTNGVKYNSVGGSVHIAAGVEDPDRFRLTVVDDGPGIAPDLEVRMFGPFERSGPTSAVPGTGSGLNLAQHLTQLMGGRIGVETELGHGSRFWIDFEAARPMVSSDDTVPVSRPVQPPAGQSVGNADSARSPSGTVLLVEDNLSNVRLMEEILRRRPAVTVVVAGTGTKARSFLQTQRPDLILLDLDLPDSSGADLLVHLRDDPAIRSVPIVVVTADATANQQQRLTDLGAADFVAKPIDVAQILSLVDHHLARPAAPLGSGILYIEDDEMSRTMMSRLLVRLLPGVDLRTAETGRDGLTAIRLMRPAVLLLDYNLPDISGAEVLAALRADPAMTGLPVIVLSGEPRPPALPPDDALTWVMKPYVLDDLVEMMSASLSD